MMFLTTWDDRTKFIRVSELDQVVPDRYVTLVELAPPFRAEVGNRCQNLVKPPGSRLVPVPSTDGLDKLVQQWLPGVKELRLSHPFCQLRPTLPRSAEPDCTQTLSISWQGVPDG